MFVLLGFRDLDAFFRKPETAVTASRKPTVCNADSSTQIEPASEKQFHQDATGGSRIDDTRPCLGRSFVRS